MVKGAAQIIADHLAAFAQMRAQMRAERVGCANRAILAAPNDKFGAKIPQRPDLTRRQFTRGADSKPAKRQRQIGITTIKHRGFCGHYRLRSEHTGGRPD